MGFFSPHKRKPNEFRYTPRYFDPVKEARNARRRELSGQDAESDAVEYKPGQYIRTKRDARIAKRASGSSARRSGSSAIIVVALLGLVVLLYMVYPRIVEAFSTANRNTASTLDARQQAEIEAFNPYAPITVVPNDYKEEE